MVLKSSGTQWHSVRAGYHPGLDQSTPPFLLVGTWRSSKIIVSSSKEKLFLWLYVCLLFLECRCSLLYMFPSSWKFNLSLQPNDCYPQQVPQAISTVLPQEIYLFIHDSTSKTWDKDGRGPEAHHLYFHCKDSAANIKTSRLNTVLLWIVVFWPQAA